MFKGAAVFHLAYDNLAQELTVTTRRIKKGFVGIAKQRFKWSVQNFGYHMQVYIYCELFGISYEDFYFLVVDKKTRAVGVFNVTEETYFKGLAETEKAIDQYKKYFVDKEEDINDFTIFGEV